jgi:hypothetical protein
LSKTPEFAKAQQQRNKVEALFAELKNQIGLRRLRLRRMKFAREQFFLAAAAQNIKRLVRFITQPATPALGSNHLTGRQQNSQPLHSRANDHSRSPSFSTPTPGYNSYAEAALAIMCKEKPTRPRAAHCWSRFTLLPQQVCALHQSRRTVIA